MFYFILSILWYKNERGLIDKAEWYNLLVTGIRLTIFSLLNAGRHEINIII